MNHQYTAPERFRDELQAALLKHAATLPSGDSVRTKSPPSARPLAGLGLIGRRLLPALAVAAVLTAALLILRSGGAVTPQPATAAGVLRASAAALDHSGGSRALGAGDYFYAKIAEWWRYADFSRHPYVVRSIYEEWLARDGHGRSRYEVVGLSGIGVSRRLPAASSQESQRRRSARPFLISTVPSPGILLSYAQLRRLPTDPNRLAVAIDRLAARYHFDHLFAQRDARAAIRFEILRQLAELPTSASLRAALYRVLAATPGIRLLGRTRDSIGRYGMAVAITVGDARLELIIDAATGELLQTSRTLLHRNRAYLDGKQPPGLINRSTYLASGIVTSTRARVP